MSESMKKEFDHLTDNHKLSDDQTNVFWQESVRTQFEAWLAEFSEQPSLDIEYDSETESPDLYSFYCELSALRLEHKKSSKRNQESFSNFNEIIEEFQTILKKIMQKQESENENSCNSIDDTLYKPFIEILTRFERLHEKLQQPPPRSLLFNQSKWQKAWDGIAEAFSLVHSHLQEFLNREDIVSVSTVGEQFDPYTMSALAVVHDPEKDHNQVIEEITPGFLRRGRVLKIAQVKVVSNKG